jgi:hypothetical protein
MQTRLISSYLIMIPLSLSFLISLSHSSYIKLRVWFEALRSQVCFSFVDSHPSSHTALAVLEPTLPRV